MKKMVELEQQYQLIKKKKKQQQHRSDTKVATSYNFVV
jgi:hypothetical protein